MKMVFTWQCPMMFMAYSVCAFLAGLTILVCTPLIRREGAWNAGCNVRPLLLLLLEMATKCAQIAVMYLTVSAIAGTMFVFCSYWVYYYVDLDFETTGEEEELEDENVRTGYELSAYRSDVASYRSQEGAVGSSLLNTLDSRIS